jgi:hypothetical protein
MLRDRQASTLHHLGIDRNNYKVLKLLPLIYVAWAKGEIEPARKERIVKLSHDHFAIGARGEAVLRGWLEKKPTSEYFREGLHEIFSLAHTPDEWGFDVDELQGLLAHAEAIARTTAAAMDQPSAVTAAEEAALADIGRELGVDDGETWAKLMRELGEHR